MFQKLTFFFALVVMTGTRLCAQAPQSFNYQAVIRDDSGNLLIDQPISLRISILEATESGDAIYVETHNKNTDNNGIVSLKVGAGIVSNGDFSSIQWGLNLHFVKMELDKEGDDNYTLMGTSQLNSVPYAMYADRVNMNNLLWSRNNDDIYYNSGNVGIGTDSPDHYIEVAADVNGDDGINRQFIRVKNINNSSKSFSSFGLSSGSDANKSDGALGVTALSYQAIAGLNGMSYVSNNENGVAIRARDANGRLKFWAGGDGPDFERMTITGNGNVGISNLNPAYNLDIAGSVNATEYLVNGLPAQFESPWSVLSNDIYYNDGFIGVGTDKPEHYIEVNADANGEDGVNRQFIRVKNFNNSSKSYSAVGLSSGTDANKSDGALGVTALSYQAIAGLNGMSYVSNNENGVAIRARDANGRLKFWAGGDGSEFERMTITGNGDIGISNTNPNSKLQVSGGDVYIDEIGSGVIMKSPDGNCWRMTVDNLGQPVFNSINCP